MFHDFFTLSQHIVPVGKTSRITLSARFLSQQFFQRGELELLFMDSDSLLPDDSLPRWRQYSSLEFEICREAPGGITFEITPDNEGEMRFVLQGKNPDYTLPVCEFGIYALESDWIDLRPYRGDFHVHTNSSECAFADEDPAYAAAVGRMRGLDFIAFTDHMQQDTGKNTAVFWQDFVPEYKIFAAEEVHQLKSQQPTLYRKNAFHPGVHIINFGGSWSVAEYENNHFEEYTQAVEQRAARLDAALSLDVRKIIAGADWIIDKIHESGGIAIYCHPYWKPHNRYDMPPAAREAIFRSNKFDAVEIIGLGTPDRASLHRECNNQAVARWQSASLAAGRLLPAVGSTDSHNSRANLGSQYTIVLAENCSQESIKQAVKAGSCAAVIAHNNEERRVYGPERLTAFVNFLLREYYPLHDERCAFEGLAMLKKLRNEDVQLTNSTPAVQTMQEFWGN